MESQWKPWTLKVSGPSRLVSRLMCADVTTSGREALCSSPGPALCASCIVRLESQWQCFPEVCGPTWGDGAMPEFVTRRPGGSLSHLGLAFEVKAVFLGTRPLNLWSLMLHKQLTSELNWITVHSFQEDIEQDMKETNSEVVEGVRKLEIFFNKNYWCTMSALLLTLVEEVVLFFHLQTRESGLHWEINIFFQHYLGQGP